MPIDPANWFSSAKSCSKKGPILKFESYWFDNISDNYSIEEDYSREESIKYCEVLTVETIKERKLYEKIR